MPFIPSPYLMTLPLRRQENDEEKMKKQKNRAILKDENEEKKLKNHTTLQNAKNVITDSIIIVTRKMKTSQKWTNR